MLLLIFAISSSSLFAQLSKGKIVYERKTNLLKKYKDEEWKEWLKEQERKIKIDVFELYFNDTASAFKPQESELREKMDWATDKNIVYQNFKNNTRLTIKDIWGEKAYMKDTIAKRVWKITDGKRKIAGYECRKALWKANDSTTIYAWYTDNIITSTGPESFNGLPGAILGLATEDGGVIYFAKSVEITAPTEVNINPPKTKSKIYTPKELRTKMEKDLGKNKWGKELIKATFDIW